MEFLISVVFLILPQYKLGRGGSVEESRIPEREVQGSNPTTAVYCSLSKTPKLPKSTGKYPKLLTGMLNNKNKKKKKKNSH